MVESNQENDVIGDLVRVFEELPCQAPWGVRDCPIRMLVELEKV
jgi:hypothetical protein